ncbi:hypothetical protein NHU_01144 [Rhodovulum sulfidophilum]|uniref:Uncharacterized protein n=1 Tax=Rhodovulum sulfidophilum TaxID=35806 RepID=A0A0D6AZI3_RHOSU|nr:hypothetical protein NHU_01144 [Rhodovulum sulfidophilum]
MDFRRENSTRLRGKGKSLKIKGELSNALQGNFGGAEGDRTPDLVIANDALSQLSYGPGER